MLEPTNSSTAPSHVRALFSDGTHTFLLPKGSTLAELADRIEDLATFHEGSPIAIHVDFDTPHLPAMNAMPPGKHICN